MSVFARDLRVFILQAGVIAALAAWPAASAAKVVTSTSGSVRAELSYQESAGSYSTEVYGLRLQISRAGEVIADTPVAAKGCDEPYCHPTPIGHKAVRVTDLDNDGEPEVLVGLFSGGAHCCWLVRIYYFDGQRYQYLTHNFLSAGFRLTNLDAQDSPEFLSSDPRFDYVFDCYACGYRPLQIWRFEAGQFNDVTASFPGRIRADAHRAGRYAFARGGRVGRGIVAAWAADRYRLGLRQATLRRLYQLAAAGRLAGEFPRSQTAFVRKLDRFLRRRGYHP